MPEVVASRQERPRSIVLDGDYVYWTDRTRGAVARTLKDGTGPVEDLATGLSTPNQMEISNGWVFFDTIDDFSVSRVPVTGGAAEVLVTAADIVRGLDVANGWVYWTDPASQSIGRIMEDGTQADATFVSDSTLANVSSVAANDSVLVWSLSIGSDYEIHATPLPPGSFIDLASGTGFVRDLSINSGDVRWLASPDVLQAPIDGGMPAEVVAPGTLGMWDSAWIGSGVYVSSIVPPAGIYHGDMGAASSDLIVESGRPEGVAADMTHLYWAEAKDGTILRITLP